MACDYCSIHPVARYDVLTRLGHRVHLCEACARRDGIVSDGPLKETPASEDGAARLKTCEAYAYPGRGERREDPVWQSRCDGSAALNPEPPADRPVLL
jgi:hypothetical protein